MRSRSRVAAWVVGLTVTAAVLTLGCGGSGEESGLQLNAVAYGDGLFVAVGDSDKAYANPGPGWTAFVTGVPALDDVAYVPALATFVAVGDAGAIVSSSDGVTWTQQGSPTPVNLYGVVAGAGRIVVVGDAGAILVSNDGVVFQERPSGTGATLYEVAFDGEATFVAVGAFGTVVISEDAGLTWQATEVGLTNELYGVAYGNDTWVVVGQAGIILQGATPFDWEVSADNVLPDLNDVLFAQSLFTVVGDNGNALTSPDGINFGASVTNTGQFLYGAAFGSGKFWVVGSGGRALSSLDGAIYQDGKI